MDAAPVTTATPASLEHLEAELCTLAAHITAATYRFLVLVDEFDRRRGWESWEMPSCAHWLHWKCSMSLRTAREHVAVAHRLGELPVTASAMARGELSFSKVRALCRMATPVTEAGLVQAARHATASHLERLARMHRHATGTDELERDRHADDHRALHLDPVDDGSEHFSARLRPDEAALVKHALQAMMDTTGEHPGERPLAKRRLDALVDICAAYLDRPEHTGDERYQVVVHVTEGVLTRDEHGLCATDDGHALSAVTVERLLCGARFTRLVTDDDGRPVAIGTASRVIPRRLRRALQARDVHCRFPGCTHRHVDAHHIEHWIRGGPTRLDNLTLLCRRHHKLVHDHGWTIERVDGRLRFRHPAGWIYGETQPVTGDPDHITTNTTITPATIQTQWHNTPIDWDTWLHTLLDGSAEPSAGTSPEWAPAVIPHSARWSSRARSCGLASGPYADTTMPLAPHAGHSTPSTIASSPGSVAPSNRNVWRITSWRAVWARRHARQSTAASSTTKSPR